MEVGPPTKWGTARYLILMVTLAMIGAALGAAVIVFARGSAGEDPAKLRYRLYASLVGLALLAMTLVGLGWMLARFAAYRTRRRQGRYSTYYVDAWAAAGKRFKLSEDDEEDDAPDGEG